MKRIAQAVLIATLAASAGVALADESQSFMSEFPPGTVTTYQDEHRSDLSAQAPIGLPTTPSAGIQVMPLASEFPQLQSYQEEHRNDVVTQASTPFPSSVSQEIPLASEFPQLRSYADEHAAGSNTTALWSGGTPAE